MSITNSECVFVTLGVQHAMRMHRILLSHVVRRLCNVFPSYLINGTIVQSKNLLNKKCFLIFYTTFI